VICSTVPVDQCVLAPVPAALRKLSHQVPDEQQDRVRVGVRLADCDEALAEVVKSQDQ
jgi:hypothetical protein